MITRTFPRSLAEQNCDDGLMHLRLGDPSVLRPRAVIAVLLTVLGLLLMHTVMMLPASASTATDPKSGPAAHEHIHYDHPAIPESHAGLVQGAQPSTGSGSSPSGGPCTTCPGCDHDTAGACALTPAKTGNNYLLQTVSDLAPAPHQLMSWPTTAISLREPLPTPPSLVALSISRT